MKPATVLITFDTHTPYLAFRVSALQSALEKAGLTDRIRLRVILLAETETSYQWASGDWSRLYGGVPVEVLADKFRPLGMKSFFMPSVWKSTARIAWRYLKMRPKVAFVGGYDRLESLAMGVISIFTRGKVGPLYDSRFNDAESYHKSIWIELVKAFMFRLYDFYMCSGRECAEYSRFLGGSRRPAYTGAWDVVDNAGIGRLAEKSDRDSEIRQHLGVAAEESYFFMPIRFLEKKNAALVIDAYAAYHRKTTAEGLTAAKLIICGQGPLENDFRSQIAALSLDHRVLLRPWLKYEDVPRASRLALALILASTHDQWGMTINEALAAGAPVLCSSRAGAHELVQNMVNGFTFHPWDQDHLTSLFYEMAHTPGLVAKLRGNAADSVKSFSIQQFNEACFAVFDRYLPSHR